MAQLTSVEFEATVRKRHTVGEYITAVITTRKLIPLVGKKVLVSVRVAGEKEG